MLHERPTLTAAELPYYLIERGLIDREAIVVGDLTIADASRRNRNLRVTRRRGRSYFVKQARNAGADALASLRREAVCYELAAREPRFAPLRAFQADYYGYDPDRHLLVLGLLSGKSAAESGGPGSPGPRETARVGRALGRLHGEGAGLRDAAPEGAFPGSLPWVLSIHRTDPSWMPATGAGQFQLVQRMNADGRFHHALDAVRSLWRAEGLIHGDLKWDNLVLADDGEVKLVDWELADVGDPAWDLGALLQSLVSFQALTLPPGSVAPGELPPASWVAIRAPATALWSAYAEARGLLPHGGGDGGSAGELLLRALRYGGGRAVQSAYEHLHQAPALTPQAMALLEIALDLMHCPERWAQGMIG